MIYCAGGIENFPFAKQLGIGLINSSISLTKSIMYDRPDEIVFIGTCGAYDDNVDIFTIFETQSATNIELSLLNEDSYTPIDNYISLEDVSHETNISTAKNIVNCSNYISTNNVLANKLLKLGIKYENMEFYSILSVAKYFNIPALGIFCVTNHTHKESQKEFFNNHKQAMKKLGEYIRNKSGE